MYKYNRYNIECLNDIHFGKNEYFYKSHSFLFDHSNESRNLIVTFHGAINRDTQLPVYRFYDYKFQNSDCLCCFDQNLSTYKKEQLLLSWFLIDSDEDIYKEIINHILQKKTYEKVIFVGSSGGGYPSVKYASIFNKSCIIFASQLYLERYNYFKHFINKTKFDNIKSYNIESLIKKHNKPCEIHLYQNIYDVHHYEEHALPFTEFCKSNEVNIICHFFEHTDYDDIQKKHDKKGYFEGWEHHGGKYNLPDGENMSSIFQSLYSITCTNK